MQQIRVGLAQMAPVWLERDPTRAKIVDWIHQAGEAECELVVFGEALLPGYPFWLDWSGGANFNHPRQKDLYAHYADQAIVIERGDLRDVCGAARASRCMVMLGTIERAPDRGGHSLYCSLVSIAASGDILSVHRKLMPTYEERLTWSPGDGHGLQVHELGDFRVGGLNCWENWMPLPRAALYAQGENLHVAVWPGAVRNTEDITRFIASESRSYVLSVSGLLTREAIPKSIPRYEEILENCPPVLANGGSCIAGPDGAWVCEPLADEERLIVADLEYARVLQERQNFDPSGHYARPDVTRLTVDRSRQSVLRIQNG